MTEHTYHMQSTTSSPDRDSGPTVRAVAILGRAFGLRIVPPTEDGEKRPETENGRWKQWQTEQPDNATFERWYRNGRTGVGTITGMASQNAAGAGLELLEFDDLDVYQRFRDTAESSGLADLAQRIEQGYSELTPGGGIHWFYYCAEVEGNTELARRPGPTDAGGKSTPEILIETRGEGGFAVLAPSHGKVHPSGKPYRVQHGSLATIATITPDERKELWKLARSYDDMPRERAPEPKERRTNSDSVSGRPGDDFNARADWADVLEPAGWTFVFARGDTSYWRRPGKDRGVSATTNHAGSNLLYVFSTSTTFDSERGYSKFGAYTLLQHHGDFKAAAQELARLGYGTARTENVTVSAPNRVFEAPLVDDDECTASNNRPCSDVWSLVAWLVERNAALEAELQRMRDQAVAGARIGRLRTVKGEKTTLSAWIRAYESAQSRTDGVDERGFACTTSTSLAEATGAVRSTTLRHLRSFQKWDFLDLETRDSVDAQGRHIELLYTRPKASIPELVDRLETFEPPKKERTMTLLGHQIPPCPEHPDAGAHIDCTCPACQRLLHRFNLSPPPTEPEDDGAPDPVSTQADESTIADSLALQNATGVRLHWDYPRLQNETPGSSVDCFVDDDAGDEQADTTPSPALVQTTFPVPPPPAPRQGRGRECPACLAEGRQTLGITDDEIHHGQPSGSPKKPPAHAKPLKWVMRKFTCPRNPGAHGSWVAGVYE